GCVEAGANTCLEALRDRVGPVDLGRKLIGRGADRVSVLDCALDGALRGARREGCCRPRRGGSDGAQSACRFADSGLLAGLEPRRVVVQLELGWRLLRKLELGEIFLERP